MIEFRWSKVDKKHNNTPVIKDGELDDLAETLLRDYKPQLLKEPCKIKHLHFLESYLGANVEFHDIFYAENEKPILGATAFNNEQLKVFNHEAMCTATKNLERRTIVIDNCVMQDGNEGLALFTGLHEGGHLWLHPAVYNRDENQTSLFDLLPGSAELPPVVCCRRSNIENFGGHPGNKTPEEWREHQADYFASAIAMPKSTFVPLVEDLLKKAGISDGVLVTGTDPEIDDFAQHTLPSIIADTYGVSKTAARIKLKKFNFVMDADNFHRKQQQTSMI